MIVLQGHRGNILRLCSLSDGRIASASMDSTIRIWNTITGICDRQLDLSGVWVTYMIQLKDGRLVAALNDESIISWHDAGCQSILRDRGQGIIWSMLETVENKLLLGRGYPSYDINICERNMHFVRSLSGHNNAIYHLYQLSDERLLSASGDWTIRIWDRSLTYCDVVLHNIVTSILEIKSAGPMQGLIAMGVYGEEALIKLWSPQTGACRFTLSATDEKERPSKVYRLFESLEDNRIWSVSFDGKVRIWDQNGCSSCPCIDSLSVPNMNALIMLKDGRMAGGVHENQIMIWDLFPVRFFSFFFGPLSLLSFRTLLSFFFCLL